MDTYHKAAQDGYLDLLRGISRKDCNKHDEDGMTPTLWASYYGHLDALRLLVGRGGDPDKCDCVGNTALHWAARNGHLDCVSFLIAFGSNLWSLDNEYHTVLDIGMMNDRGDIVRNLDEAISQQSKLNKKFVAKLKEKALVKAHKRIKTFKRLQKKTLKKAEKIDRKLEDRLPYVDSSRNKSRIISDYDSKSYSSYMTVKSNKSLMNGVARKISKKKTNDPEFKVACTENDGSRTIKSLSGLKRDNQILYVKNKDYDNISRTVSEPDIHFNSNCDNDIIDLQDASIFERPGFGSVSFLQKRSSGNLSSLLTDHTDITPPEAKSHDKLYNGYRKNDLIRQPSCSDSIGTVGSLELRMNEQLNREDDESSNQDDFNQSKGAFKSFLSSINLTDYLNLFLKEQIDLDSLMLLTDADLIEIGLPMGPRRKLTAAINRRKNILSNPGVILDSFL